jgi:hypothetical protein
MDRSRLREFDDVPVPRLKRPRTGNPTKSSDSNVTGPRREIRLASDGDRRAKRRNRNRNETNNGNASHDNDSGGDGEDPTKKWAEPKRSVKREVENEDPSESQDDEVNQTRAGPEQHGVHGAKIEQETLEKEVDPPDDRNDVSEQEEAEDSESSVEMSADGWARLENSGRGLTAMVEAAGVRGVRVEQWYNVPQVSAGGRVFALVLLYKWGIDRGDATKWNPSHAFVHAGEETAGGGPRDIMLISQLINSGSATQAIISALLNIPESSDMGEQQFDLGEELSLLRAFMLPMPHFVRGTAVCSSKAVRSAHDAAATKFRAPSVADIAPEVRPSEDLWMYSVFMPGVCGRWVYEMNGCADEPIVLGSADPDPPDAHPRNTWIDSALDPIMQRIEDCRTHRVRFQLFAVVDSAYDDESVNTGEDLPGAVCADNCNAMSSPRDFSAQNGDLDCSGMENGNGLIASCIRRLKSQMNQNPELRKTIATHNYDIFFIEMMKLMASRGDLNRFIGQATATNGHADGNASASSTH